MRVWKLSPHGADGESEARGEGLVQAESGSRGL